MDDILAVACKSAQTAEVFRVTSSRTPVQFEANRLKQIQTKDSTVTALRLVKDGRVGFAQASGRINAAELVNMALDTSQFGFRAGFTFPYLQPNNTVKIYDPSVENVTIDDMIGLGSAIIDAVCANTAGIL
ncbi:MAG: TldD/PmbA family protein, partial [Chloroflexi bacterium]|nr:TldD/PmbA family protein [Chloroflexota bacterium]